MTNDPRRTTSSREPSAPSNQHSTATGLTKIAGHITRLLLHFWTANDSPEARQLQIEDWLDDLREFRPEIVEGACQRWRRAESKRPTPANIRQACLDEMRDYPGYYNLDEPDQRQPRIAGPSNRDAWVRSLGWASFAEREEAIRRNNQRYEDGLRWQQEHVADLAAARGT